MVRGQCHAVAVLCCFAASASQCNALRPTRRRELLVSTAAMYYKWGSVVMAPSHAVAPRPSLDAGGAFPKSRLEIAAPRKSDPQPLIDTFLMRRGRPSPREEGCPN